MYKINIGQAKAHLSAILGKLRPGDTITLCNRNVPIAEIRYFGAPNKEGKGRRPLGKFADSIEVSSQIVDPLPEDMLSYFLKPHLTE